MNLRVFVFCFLAFMEYSAGRRMFGNPDEWGDNFEGDILLPSTSRGLFRGDYFLWVDGKVPFWFSSNFSKERIHDVLFAFDIYNFMTRACINFVVRDKEPDYLNFMDDGKVCSSFIGRERGAQPVFLADHCFEPFGVILHEVLHALGFEHEHSRSDRDDFVIINYENLMKGSRRNFAKRQYNKRFERKYPYDYDSIMHYSPYAYSDNGKRTVVPTNPAYTNSIGQRIRLSEKDTRELKDMYGCSS